jgi:hypothetical protein
MILNQLMSDVCISVQGMKHVLPEYKAHLDTNEDLTTNSWRYNGYICSERNEFKK